MELGGGGGSSSDGGGLMGFTRDNHNSSGSSNGGLSSMTTMMHISNSRPTTTTDHHYNQHLMPSRPPHHPPNNHVMEIMNNNNIPLSSSNNNNHRNHITCFPSSNSDHHQHQIFDQNNNKVSAGCKYFMKQIMNNNHHHEDIINNNTHSSSASGGSFRAKIMSHPHYPRLLTAYVNCQKVGAPPEVVKRLEEVCAASSEHGMQGGGRNTTCIGEDPGLDQFMEAYCEMLTKYEQELTKPFKEAMLFLSNIESQLKSLSVVANSSDTTTGQNGSSEEEIDASENYIDPHAEDRELKSQLLRKYSGYLGSLKQEFLKKRKKGKLPKEARQQLLDWWSRHYKWPYPSETQKLALAESTGLDQKQINNWFINQRKRHWKPSEEMQFVVMDATNPNQYYIENVLTNPFSIDYCTQSSLL